MTRTITPAEIKPGMTIQWESEGITRECTVAAACTNSMGGVEITAPGGGRTYVWSGSVLTVLMEAQPEEPTEFGAKVIMDGRRFLRVPLRSSDSTPWLSQLDGRWRGWDDLCEMGPVTVIPDQGWTAPETPVVPERIEEWPEDDEHLRAYSWRDHDGDTWGWLNDEAEWECRSSVDIRLGTSRRPVSEYGPWTRKDD